uniref:Uncharacterized protein n=1 Tax=Globodera rostochiensis TaxID=31243 RepID=A0A914HX62_GLORO
MNYGAMQKKCSPPPSSYFGPHNVFIDVHCDLPWYFHRNYSAAFKYSHFYGGCWKFPYSDYPFNALYKSPWLNRPYHNMGAAPNCLPFSSSYHFVQISIDFFIYYLFQLKADLSLWKCCQRMRQ